MDTADIKAAVRLDKQLQFKLLEQDDDFLRMQDNMRDHIDHIIYEVLSKKQEPKQLG